ncbi:TolC family protein [Roseiconus lacunae]|uniref:TolC family protein n=1 Tax=Roseiconus lacunae TaxID=2605694 RepID=A0ABT7PPS5_9BACT|nr:TolC family protein [Roseiconus lacunae]MDM4018289.1 TolC family protein [Roseiconus lacunae]
MKRNVTKLMAGGLVCLCSGCGMMPTGRTSSVVSPTTDVRTNLAQANAIRGFHSPDTGGVPSAAKVTGETTDEDVAKIRLTNYSDEKESPFSDLLAQQATPSNHSVMDGVSDPQPIEFDEANVATFDQSVASLDELIAVAFGRNPAIAELAATTQKAAGYRTQVSLYANPIVGYQGQQLADKGTDQHLIFIDQEIVTGNKLQLNRAVLNEALRAQLQELEAQKMRVTTDLKTLFYDSVQLQQQLELITAFARQLERGVELAEKRYEVGEGTRIDVLQTRVQLKQLELDRQQKSATLRATLRQIAAVCGTPNRVLTGVTQDNLPAEPEMLDWVSLADTIVASSPEYSAAHARIRQASLAVRRHEAQPLPNLMFQVGTGVDYATGGHGLINVQAGAPIPVFNKNQGNIAAAKAEYCRAIQEAERVDHAIRSRLAEAAGEYERAAEAVKMYSGELLPAAQQSVDLAEEAYRAGEQDFIQLLVTRRTYFDTNLSYVQSRGDLAIAKAKIDGYLLTGALNAVIDGSGDDSLRGLTFSQQ